MRGTRNSLTFASILIASAALPLNAQIGMQFGDTPATTVLTTSQRTFAESYLAAVTGSDIERYKVLLHPATRACMNKDNADYFKTIFDRRVGKTATKPVLSVEKLPEKFAMFDAMSARGWKYDVRPTHAFHIDLVSTGFKQSALVAFSALDAGVWYEVLPCPNGKALIDMREAKLRDEAEWARARSLAASLRNPLRAEVLAFLEQDRPVSAARRYAEGAHVDLTLASRVIDVLEKEKR
ncbi:MAG TPA: hypothetical protein VKB91_08320 [Gemmatimonadaceae bacterium]|nr:hypothetical protein [Gemmatimonadaceae bacterium]